jgi:hypothetical protein
VVARLLLAYAAWVAALALAFWFVLSTHALAMRGYLLFGLDYWGVAIFNDVVFIVLVLAWLIWVIVTEHWLRGAAGRACLRPALLGTLGPVAVLAIGAFSILQLT